MAQAGYSAEELKQGVVNQPFQRLMGAQAMRARGYFDTGSRLLPLLSPRSRACPAVLGQLYSLILDRIEAQGFDVFNGKVRLNKREKYLVTAQTWVRSLLPMAPSPT
jgi:phytoene synthase